MGSLHLPKVNRIRCYVVSFKVHYGFHHPEVERKSRERPFDSASPVRNGVELVFPAHNSHVDLSGSEQKQPLFKSNDAEPGPVITNANSVKVTVPEKRTRIEKSEVEMPPPPPVPTKSNSSSLISAIHEEVEQKLEKQKKENRDVMEIVTVGDTGGS